MAIRKAASNKTEDWTPKQLQDVRNLARRGGSIEEAISVLQTTRTVDNVRSRLRKEFNITFARKPRSKPGQET